MAETVFGEYQPGSRVNLEVDVIARYLERLYAGRCGRAPRRLTCHTLAENGYFAAAAKPRGETLSHGSEYVDELISDIRQGRMVVLLDDDADSHNEGVVMVAAEHCEASHVTLWRDRPAG